MKQLQILMLFLFTVAVLVSACGNDDGAVSADAGNGKVAAKVDGKSWESKDTNNGAVYGASQGTHLIQAYSNDGSYISLTIFGNITTGAAIPVTNGIFQAQYKPDAMDTEAYAALGSLGSGSITFTTFNDSKVKGTFEFAGVKIDQTGAQTQIEVKDGSFDINL
jgi:hypothetical protein